MTNDYPFHIRREDYGRLVSDSRRERDAWKDYIAVAGDPSTPSRVAEFHREAWRAAAAHLAENVSYILRMHLLVADVLAAGEPDQ